MRVALLDRAMRRALGPRALAAAVLATAALGTFLVIRAGIVRGLERRDADLLGGRAVLGLSRPFPPAIVTRAREAGLRTATWVRFPTAVVHGSRVALATVLAAGARFPLDGRFHVRSRPGGPVRRPARPPRAGRVWLAPALAAFLHVEPGDFLRVGMARFRIAGLVDSAPGIGWREALLAPPLVLPAADLPATRLVLVQSRVTYGLSLSGPRPALTRFLAWVRAHFPRTGVRTRRDVVRALRATARRVTRYAALVVLAVVALSALALGLGARALARRVAPLAAYLVAQGASSRRLRRLLLGALARRLGPAVLAGVAAALLGVVLVRTLLGRVLPLDLGPASVLARLGLAALAVFVMVFLLFAESLAPLARGSPAAALRRVRLEPGRGRGIALAALLLLAAALLVPGTRGPEGRVLGALVLAAVLLPVVFRGLFAFLVRLARTRAAGLWWLAVSLARRGWTAGVEAAALAFALGLALAAVGVGHAFVHDLDRAFRKGRPNWFLYGITPRERAPLARALARAGLGRVDFAPLVTARLVRVDGRRLHARSPRYRRAAWLIRHDQNLSSAARLPPANRLVRGHFWSPATRRAEASLARRFARLLHLRLGDRLTYVVAGRRLTLRVTSIRHVDWWSFRPNFFVLATPAALRGLPRSYLTSLSVPEAKLPRLVRVLRRSPGVSAVDASALLRLVDRALRESRNLVFLEAGGLVLAALLLAASALEESGAERRRERALLALWGVGPARLRRLALGEAALLAAVSGLAGGVGAALFTDEAMRNLLHLSPPPLLWMVPAAFLGGGLFLGASWLLAPRAPVRSYAALRLLDVEGGSL